MRHNTFRGLAITFLLSGFLAGAVYPATTSGEAVWQFLASLKQGKEFHFDVAGQSITEDRLNMSYSLWLHTLDAAVLHTQWKPHKSSQDFFIIFAGAGAGRHQSENFLRTKVEIHSTQNENSLVHDYPWPLNVVLLEPRTSTNAKILGVSSPVRHKEVLYNQPLHRKLRYFSHGPRFDNALYARLLLKLKKTFSSHKIYAMAGEKDFLDFAAVRSLISSIDSWVILRNNSDGSDLQQTIEAVNHKRSQDSLQPIKVLLMGSKGNEVQKLKDEKNITILSYRFIKPGFAMFFYNHQLIKHLQDWLAL